MSKSLSQRSRHRQSGGSRRSPSRVRQSRRASRLPTGWRPRRIGADLRFRAGPHRSTETPLHQLSRHYPNLPNASPYDPFLNNNKILNSTLERSKQNSIRKQRTSRSVRYQCRSKCIPYPIRLIYALSDPVQKSLSHFKYNCVILLAMLTLSRGLIVRLFACLHTK